MKQTIVIVIFALLALAAGVSLRQLIDQQEMASQSLPHLEFTLPDLTGINRNINEWQGKIRVINFWATWCPPCLKEIPEFIALQNRFTGHNVQFIGIAVEDRSAVSHFIDNHPINYPILIGGDTGIALSQQLGNLINAIPFTIIVNPQGQIIYRHPGEISAEKLFSLLQPLMQR